MDGHQQEANRIRFEEFLQRKLILDSVLHEHFFDLLEVEGDFLAGVSLQLHFAENFQVKQYVGLYCGGNSNSIIKVSLEASEALHLSSGLELQHLEPLEKDKFWNGVDLVLLRRKLEKRRGGLEVTALEDLLQSFEGNPREIEDFQDLVEEEDPIVE